eukprot:Opistho-2@92497
MAVRSGRLMARIAVVAAVAIALFTIMRSSPAPPQCPADGRGVEKAVYESPAYDRNEVERGAHEAEPSPKLPEKDVVAVEVDEVAADPMRIAPLSAAPVRTRHFEGSNMLSRVRIAVADSLNDDSRERCFAVTAASLFPFAFEHIEGKDDGSHVSEWMQNEYCQPHVRYTQPKFVLIVATCVHIPKPLNGFAQAAVVAARDMEAVGTAAAGDIRLSVGVPEGTPYIHPGVLVIDTHKYFEFGCPDMGPFNATAKASLQQPLPHFTYSSGNQTTAGSLRRRFVAHRPDLWFVKDGTPRFMTNFFAVMMARNGIAITLPAVLTSIPRRIAPATDDVRALCGESQMCLYITQRAISADGVIAAMNDELRANFPYSASRSGASTGCFDFAEISGCKLSESNRPAYLGTNEAPHTITRFARGTSAYILPRLAPGSLHFMSVVGGMNGLNVAVNFAPTSITFFDFGASPQICVGRLFLEVLKMSDSRADFVTAMFGRDFAKFVSEDPEGEMTVTSQVRYLMQPVDETILKNTLAGLSSLGAECYSKFFVPKMRTALEYRTYTPVFVFNKNPGPLAGNNTINYGVPGGYLGSEVAMIGLRDAVRRSPIGFADFDFNQFRDLLLHRETQRSDNLVVHISNADDKHFPYIPNIEGVLEETSIWLRHVAKPSKVFVVSTNGVYMASREGWTFDTGVRNL